MLLARVVSSIERNWRGGGVCVHGYGDRFGPDCVSYKRGLIAARTIQIAVQDGRIECGIGGGQSLRGARQVLVQLVLLAQIVVVDGRGAQIAALVVAAPAATVHLFRVGIVELKGRVGKVVAVGRLGVVGHDRLLIGHVGIKLHFIVKIVARQVGDVDTNGQSISITAVDVQWHHVHHHMTRIGDGQRVVRGPLWMVLEQRGGGRRIYRVVDLVHVGGLRHRVVIMSIVVVAHERLFLVTVSRQVLVHLFALVILAQLGGLLVV